MASINEVVEASWAIVAHTPGVMRNTAFGASRRRVLDGAHGFVVQFNPAHISTKRPASSFTPGSALTVSRPFDASKFNFNRASRAEVICDLELRGTRSSPSIAVVYAAAGARSGDASSATSGGGVSAATAPGAAAPLALFVNVNPLLPCHSLLVPAPAACHPQVFTRALLGEVLLAASVFRGRPDWRFGFNSLAAWASVNHFHVQVVRCRGDERAFEGGAFPLETAARRELVRGRARHAPGRELCLELVTGYALRALVFSVSAAEAAASPASVEAAAAAAASPAAAAATALAPPSEGAPRLPLPLLAADADAAALLQSSAGAFLERLVAADVAHTVLIADAGRAVIVVPRLPQAGPAGGDGAEIIIAFAEISGLGILYTEADFESYTEARFNAKLAAVNLEEAAFDALQAAAVAHLHDALSV